MAVLLLLIGGLVLPGALPAPPAGAATELFEPLVPARLLDTRVGGATIDGRFAGEGIVTDREVVLEVTGRGGVPVAGVTAVVINVTVVDGRTANGYVTVYPTGATRPNASSLNFGPGDTVPNELVAKVGTGGSVSLFVSGSGQLVVDVVGWMGDESAAPPFELRTLAAGTGLSCAVRTDARVLCWGDGTDGGLGTGSNTSSNVPVVVAGLTGAVSVTTGGAYACALTSDGAVSCWGRNFGGQLGTGDTDNSNTPVRVEKIPPMRAIAAGNGLGTCGISNAGQVWCWGGFTYGVTPRRLTRAGGVPLAGVVSISAGGGHGCALTSAAQVYCFGSDVTGATGPGALDGDVRRVAAADGALAVAAAGAHSCALTPARTVLCWGANGRGQLGTGQSSANSPTPVTVAGLSDVTAIAGGTGNGITCARRVDTTLWCWGENSSGELGNGITQAFSASPTQVVGLSGVTAVSAGFAHTCALLADGGARCWGFNFSGQVGNGTNVATNVPAVVSGLTVKQPVGGPPVVSESGGGFESLVPARVMDTRTGGATVDGRYAGTGALASGTTVDVQVTGRGGVPDTGVGAVVVNITAVGGQGDGGYLTVYPKGEARPNASSVNFGAGSIVANEVVAKVGLDGSLSVSSYQGTDVLLDVVGWVPTAGLLHPLTPARLADTRRGGTTVDGQAAGTGRISVEFPRMVEVLGRGGVPASGVDAVVLNVTVVDGGADDGYLTVFPTGSSLPNASSLNFRRGQTVANEVVAKVGTMNSVTLFAYGGADVVVDVVGWTGVGGGATAPGAVTPPPTSNPDRFVAVYARAQGVPAVAGRAAAIAHEIAVVQQWFDGQTGGEHPRFLGGGTPSVVSVELPMTATALSNSTDPEAEIWRAIAADPALGGAFPVVYYEGSQSGGFCGRAGPYMVYLPMATCGTYPGAATVWPGGATYVMAHEVTHVMGAVRSCAPNAGNGGHVIDDPRDLLYAGTQPRDWANLTLDPGRDDYYLHGRTDCADIANSPLLGTG